MRRARLIVHFGLQGFVFGMIYAGFYSCIAHRWGVLIIVVCSTIFAAVPWLLRRSGALGLAGHLLVGTMAAGFTLLTLVEGGIHSHAIAWLASVPLCALLLLGVRPASIWAGVCFLTGATIALATLAGWIHLEPFYEPRWHTLVDAAGNLGITLFLFALGLVFEISRAEAFTRMQASLDELATSNAELAHLNNEKTDFLGIAAHDLRNPLTAIIGFSDLLEKDEIPRVSAMAAIISKAGSRMLELITDLLDANAIEAGSYATEISHCDLRGLVVTSLQHHQLAAEKKRIALELTEGPPCWVKANPKAAIQILDNLISNAVKYSPPGSRVALHVRAGADWGEFSVRDQGPGISAADQQRLFQKHTRLSAQPTGGESSVGLGLSIVKRLAETMGGGVACESTLGAGATFALRLPRAPLASVAA